MPLEYLGINLTLRSFEDSKGALWIAFNRKLYRLANGDVTVFTKNEIPALNELVLQVVFEDTQGSLWFVFGATNYTRKLDGQLVRFKDNKFTSYNLGRLVVATSGTIDREGNFWLATPTGLWRLQQQLITSLSVKDGLISNEVYPLLQTNKGDILIGTIQGVNRYSNGKITNAGLKYSANFPLYMRGLWEDERAQVWLGYQGEGGFGRFEELRP